MSKLRQLTEQEYFDLQAQFDKTPAPQDSFGASGEHYIMVMLLNNMGFYPRGKNDALKLADKLLMQGYQR